jgi:hypothetical protein
VCDGEDPRRKLRVRAVGLPGAKDAEERLLDQILRLVAPVAGMFEDGQQSILIAPDEFFEREGVVVPHAQHQPGVRIDRRLDRRSAGRR